MQFEMFSPQYFVLFLEEFLYFSGEIKPQKEKFFKKVTFLQENLKNNKKGQQDVGGGLQQVHRADHREAEGY